MIEDKTLNPKGYGYHRGHGSGGGSCNGDHFCAGYGDGYDSRGLVSDTQGTGNGNGIGTGNGRSSGDG
jgi:hypothetical protein